MRKISKTSCLLLIILLTNIIALSGCKKNTVSENRNKAATNIQINDKNAKAISITNPEITNISNVDKNNTVTKIENTSNFYISNIWLGYEELDKNNNMISNSETFLDLTLAPGEISYIAFPHKEYAKSIKVTSYGYDAENKIVSIYLKKDVVKIRDNQQQIENSKIHEVLTISDVYKKNDSNDKNTYAVKVKNSSQIDLGNIALKIGELKNDEYVAVNHLAAYNVLKESEEIEIDIVATTDADKLKIIGYSYDDVKEKANIEIDLKSHTAKINK